jgi:large subunit ribosomal protein L23
MREPQHIIKEMLVTEKGTRLAEAENQYLFKVALDANKVEIKHSVETLFKVSVRSVNTMNQTGKRKRERSMKYGRTARWKKAVVTLRAGETIELV